MLRRLLPIACIGLSLFFACSETDDNPVAPGPTVFQVPEMSLAAALAAAVPGDRVLLTGAGPAIGDFVLPPNVSLYRHADSMGQLFQIIGSLRSQDSDEGTRIEGLKISNPEGSGLLLANSAAEVSNVWLVDCGGAGLELAGRSSVYAHDSDFENCRPGVLIRDVFSSGHHESGSAPRIASNNFIGNQPFLDDVNNDDIDEELGPNLVFHNVSAGDTVYVSWNWWGERPGDVDPEETIWDHKDEVQNQGLADTKDGYSPTTELYDRDWHDD